MIKLDKRDLKILSILQHEGRITKTALAERVNLSPTPCWERLKRLEKAGVITGYSAKISIKSLKNISFFIMETELDSHHSNDFLRFEQAVMPMDEVLECWAVGGRVDYFLKIVAASIDDYQRFVDSMLAANIGIKHYCTYIVTRRVKESWVMPEHLLKDNSAID